ncbi:MAG: electron transport complex protein RnfA, partial [Oscillospiraceae bacterium]
MALAKSMMIILLTGILTDNFVLSKFLGICPFLGVSKTTSGSLGMGCAVTVVMVLATAVTWPLYYLFLEPMGLTYLNTILFILIIALFVQLVEMLLKKYIPALYKSLGVYLPLITTNCAVLGVTLLNLENGYNFLESIVCALGGGIGFLVAMLIFSGVRGRLEKCNVPKAFQGVPITLV